MAVKRADEIITTILVLLKTHTLLFKERRCISFHVGINIEKNVTNLRRENFGMGCETFFQSTEIKLRD